MSAHYPRHEAAAYVWSGSDWVPMTQPGDLSIDDALDVHNHIWDTNTLAWVVQTTASVVSGAVSVSNFPATQPISAVALPLPTDAATQTTLALIKAKTDNLDGLLSTRLTESDYDTKTGSLTESAPGTDTASSGLNGRLQRVAQRLTSLIALLPAALGAGGGLKVDGSGTALPVSGTVTANAGTNLNTSALALDASVTALKPAQSVTAVQATASGDTTVVASSTHKYHRIEASNSHATTALVVGLKIPSLNGGSVFGKKYLPAAGGQAVWVFPKGYLQGTSEALSVNLSTTGQVEVTAYYE